jgi:methyl-accepting chemotaxis protein
MTPGDPFLGGIIVSFFTIVILIVVIVLVFVFRRQTNRKIDELERQITSLQKDYAEQIKSIEERFGSLKDIVFEKTNLLAKKLNEISKRIDAVLEKTETVGKEIDRRVQPVKSMFDDSVSKVTASHDTMRKRILEGEKVIDRMAKDIDAFSDTIKEMKDFIRERNIDLEL